jgi:hypothetical protein
MIILRGCSRDKAPGLVGVVARAYGQGVSGRHLQWREARATVLVVADDAVARDVYTELFAMRGYAVVAAADARDGLLQARRRRVTVVVLALTAGAAQLRRRLLALRPRLRVHVTGMIPLWLGFASESPRPQLH